MGDGGGNGKERNSISNGSGIRRHRVVITGASGIDEGVGLRTVTAELP